MHAVILIPNVTSYDKGRYVVIIQRNKKDVITIVTASVPDIFLQYDKREVIESQRHVIVKQNTETEAT